MVYMMSGTQNGADKMTINEIIEKAIAAGEAAQASRQAQWDAADWHARRQMISPDADAEITRDETLDRLLHESGLVVGSWREKRQIRGDAHREMIAKLNS